MAGTKLRKTAIALFLSAMAQSVLADGLTDQAKTLIDAGKAKEAFILLDVEENARAGDPLFGIRRIVLTRTGLLSDNSATSRVGRSSK